MLCFLHTFTHTKEGEAIKVSAEEIMDYSGVCRSVVYLALKKMEKLGLQRVKQNTYNMAEFMSKVKELNDGIGAFRDE